MLTPDHPNALWLAEMYRGGQSDQTGLSEEERNRFHAKHLAKYMARMSPDLIIHTDGVRLAATGDMAFMKAYGRRRPALSERSDVLNVAVNQVLSDHTNGILNFHSRTVRGTTLLETVVR